jgi:hypothetical protein
MVQTENVDVEGSGEDEQDEYVPSTMIVSSALLHIQQLQDFACSRPDLFTSQSELAVRAIESDMQNHRAEKQKDGNTASFFAYV